ncbi:hypothetical protein [Lentilactobacillus rapi]|uniref:hypothetical protein n=1 Tax=Lentilactobacillus rapi TaxID=481723 RepID=UPI001FB37E68|nr:hypothetical protein [Lentilactobacillus rapi]
MPKSQRPKLYVLGQFAQTTAELRRFGLIRLGHTSTAAPRTSLMKQAKAASVVQNL